MTRKALRRPIASAMKPHAAYPTMPPALNSMEAMATRLLPTSTGRDSPAAATRMICGYQVDTLQKATRDPVASAVETSVLRSSGGDSRRRSTNWSCSACWPERLRERRPAMWEVISGGSGTWRRMK